MLHTIKNNLTKHRIPGILKKKKKGAVSLIYLIACMIGVITFITAYAEYCNIVIVRTLEAASDLAAEEALRAYVDEAQLRNEHLYIDPANFPAIRDLYLEKVRRSVPQSGYTVLRVEIPTINAGEIEIPADIINGDFPNSTSTAFVDYGSHGGGTQQWFLLDGTTPADSAIAIVRDTGNIDTASPNTRTSYIISVKMTVIYDSMDLLNRSSFALLNYADIFTDTPVTLRTVQSDSRVTAVTIESEGKVTLR